MGKDGPRDSGRLPEDTCRKTQRHSVLAPRVVVGLEELGGRFSYWDDSQSDLRSRYVDRATSCPP